MDWVVKRTGIAALALPLLLLVTSCQRFGVAGDSVTFDAREELGQKGGLVRAFGGVRIAGPGREAVRRLAGRTPGVVVVALGLNDVSFDATPAELRQRITATMRDDLEPVACAIWIDLKLSSNVHDNWPVRAGQFNAILQQLAARYGVHVARWSVVAPLHRDWFRPDGLHLNQRGQVGYANFVAERIRHFCGPAAS